MKETLGNNVILYIWTGTGEPPELPAEASSFPIAEFATNYTPVAGPQELTLNRAGTPIEYTTKLDGAYGKALMGRLRWTGSASGVISFNSEEEGDLASLVTMFNSRKLHRVFITELGDAATSLVPEANKRAYVGDVLISSLNETYSDQQVATYSLELQGSGSLVTVKTAASVQATASRKQADKE